jgi:hypothetical protein
MRAFLILLLASVVALTVAAQTLNRRETLTVGIDLTLGMSEDAAVKRLTESGHKMSKHEPPDALKQKGFTSMWFIDEGSLGIALFSGGQLTSVSKDLLPKEGGQVEFARQLYFAMRDLEAEGNSRCTIETENAEVPEFAHKTARLRCGKKSLVIDLQNLHSKGDSVQLNEELNAH